MVTEYHFTDLWVLAGVTSYLFCSLFVIKKIVDRETVSNGWKAFWVGVVVFFPVIGLLAWFIAGRKPHQ